MTRLESARSKVRAFFKQTWLKARTLTDEGLTLIEMLAVVVIMGVVAAIAIPAVSKAITQSKVDSTEATLGTLQTALARYEMDTGSYPSSLSQLITSGATDWSGPYVQDTFPVNDGWGNQVYYDPVWSGTTVTGYMLVSGDGQVLGLSGTTTNLKLGSSSPVPTGAYVIAAAGGVNTSGTALAEQPKLLVVSTLPSSDATLVTATTGPTGANWTDS